MKEVQVKNSGSERKKSKILLQMNEMKKKVFQYLSCLSSIACKEFTVLIKSPSFFGILSLLTGIWSYLFLRALSQFVKKGGNIHFELFFQHFHILNLVFILAIPLLTMKLLSEEKRNSTYDLLLTSPITATQIVVGKFFGALGVALVLLLFSFFYPFSTALIADLPWGPLLTSYFGLILLLGIYVAIGIFSSSLTDSILLSAIMGFILNIMTWFIGQGSAQLKDTKFARVMEQISLGEHFVNFMKGMIHFKSMVFFLSFIVLFVFLAQRVVESSRWR